MLRQIGIIERCAILYRNQAFKEIGLNVPQINMLIDERYDEILKILDEEQYITAQELAKRLYVSLPTIRRDLAELDQRNLIVRSHGGAKKVHDEHTVAPLNYRKTVNAQEKRALCRAAAELIQDNEIVFIDSSTTTLQMGVFYEKYYDLYTGEFKYF